MEREDKQVDPRGLRDGEFDDTKTTLQAETKGPNLNEFQTRRRDAYIPKSSLWDDFYNDSIEKGFTDKQIEDEWRAFLQCIM